jgi:NAD(P)-dependent dehydrogenase (short-subunit alcohol dehydrogenase family)
MNVFDTAEIAVKPRGVGCNAVALVMNGGSDAGPRRVRALLRAGYRVAVTGPYVTHLTRAIQGQSATRVLAIAADPADQSQVTKLVNRVESEFGGSIDLVMRDRDGETTE